MERYEPNINIGLTDEQVKERIANNLVNFDTSVPTKSIKQILFENFFTLFNLLNLVFAIAIFSIGSYKNMLFLLIVIINTAISTIQEIHSKRVVDKLSIMASSKAKVIRNGKKEQIHINDIVIKSKKNISQVNYELTMLTVEGYVKELPGKNYIRM